MEKIGLTIALIAGLSACATSRPILGPKPADVLLQNSDSLQSPSTLTRGASQDDIALLTYTLKTGYGGRDFIPQEDFAAAINGLDMLSATTPDGISSVTLCDQIAGKLQLIRDAHLGAFQISENGSRPCGTDPIGTRKGQVGKNVANYPNSTNSKTHPGWELRWKKDVALIAIPKFPVIEDPSWKGFTDAVLEAKAKARAIIIDMRGNGGGSDMAAWQMAEILYGAKAPNPVEIVIRSTTPQTLALRVNSYELKIRRLKSKAELVPSWLDERITKAKKDYVESLGGGTPPSEQLSQQSGPGFLPSKGYDRPIFILVDRGCLSACENALQAFEGHPRVMTVGENTGGAVHFGTVGDLVLHHSQIVIGIATDYWRFRDGRFVEKVGYAPRFLVQPGGDALETSLKELKVLTE